MRIKDSEFWSILQHIKRNVELDVSMFRRIWILTPILLLPIFIGTQFSHLFLKTKSINKHSVSVSVSVSVGVGVGVGVGIEGKQKSILHA